MRNAIVVMTLALGLAGGALHAETARTPPADVGDGRIAWFDLTTTDLAKSKEFYGKLLGWTFAALPETNMAVEIVASGTSIGTLRVGEGAISPFNGVVYVQVADLTASCKAAREAGGTVAPGFPFNLPDGIGAIALILDPVGHPIGMYSRTPLPEVKAGS